jgi:hypothetical protein
MECYAVILDMTDTVAGGSGMGGRAAVVFMLSFFQKRPMTGLKIYAVRPFFGVNSVS